MHVTPEFLLSYEALENYPQNLINQTLFPAALKAYKSRLDSVADTLFEKNDDKINVPFRDLDPSTPGNFLALCYNYSISYHITEIRSSTKTEHSQRYRLERMAWG